MKHLFSKRTLILGLVLLGLLGGWMLTGRQAEAIERPALNAALLATVRLAVPVDNAIDQYSTGSGTVLTSDGLILTNYHVMADTENGRLYNRDGMAFVAVNPPDLRSEAVWKYRATVVKSSRELDLAILQVTGLMEQGDASLSEHLDMTTAPLGSSNDLLIGDEINLFGFPSIGRGSVTFTRGIVAGFMDEDGDGVLDWIKTDADVARGNSGGLATDAGGRMIGIPSADIADVETASSISLIRPIDLALPLIRAAQGQVNATDVDRDSPNRESASSGPDIVSLQFAAAIDHNGNAIDTDSRFNPGIKAVYAVFEYANLVNGEDITFTWRHEGREVARTHFRWQGGASGTDWVNVYARDALASGQYELELKWNDTVIYTGGFWIGDVPSPPSGRFGAIVFATAMDDSQQPLNPDVVFSDVDVIYAFFDVYDMSPGIRWQRRWYIDDELALETEGIWKDASARNWWISIQARGGLTPGRYRLELLIEGRLDQQAEFTIPEPPWRKGVEPVQIIGTISDASRKSRKLASATVFVLNPGVSVHDFLAQPDQSMVVAYGVSNQKGDYQLNERLTPGQAYGIVVYHKEYQMVTADAFAIDAQASSPWRIDVTMKRK